MVIRTLSILALLALSLSTPAYALTTLETSVDRNPAIEGEYLVLSIKADDDVDNGSLDTSILLKDFIVGRTSVSRSTQIMNFDASKETRWQVLLAPKRAGIIEIPALTIKGVSSAPIKLTVSAPGSQPQQMKSLFIRSSLSSEEAYVGQLITYKVKLYLAVELQRGVLSAPNVEGAQLKQLGEDIDTTEILDGRRYRVIERTYSIIADTPGKLTLSGASFSGDVLVEAARRGGMFSFNESRPMQAKAAPSEVTIYPIPSDYHGKWLVSDLVVLKEDWPASQTFEVGVPLTRNITLLASNTDETSLPELSINLPEGFKQYPEKPQRQTFVREKQVVAQLKQTTAIVPTQAGSYTLPEIKVPWWNNQTNKQEFATLPARTITVSSSSSTPEVIPSTVDTTTAKSHGYWQILTAIFALLWLSTLLLWRRHIRKLKLDHVSPPTTTKHSHSETPSMLAIEAACRSGQAGAIILALQQHFSAQFANKMTLAEIAGLTPALGSAIKQLQQAAYSPATQHIDGQQILDAVKNCPMVARKTAKSALNPLNPL
ncbi:hypothetical protein BEL05_08780 [Shewanella colwelliana]|uniref:DUF7939 domain-containing protein n=1 Tax=Shewanella colwelliana TaxID=23 RepID=A0A1E5IXL1_SHECO|nr:BatD family protein [Shewanella colwelliana]OEG75295.1 hypothetical protein BEL05_08780 [Shewanella colwelliana]